MAEWIIPFKGYNYSGVYNQNFLWKEKSLYVMDNHRAAMWCWFQNINTNKEYNLFHIDRHTDTLYNNIDNLKAHMPDMQDISIKDYINLSYKKGNKKMKLFSRDNYLSLFLECYPNLLNYCYFATYNDGDDPKYKKIMNIDFWEIPENMNYWIYNLSEKWIFNIDIDYFVIRDPKVNIFSDHFIEKMFNPIVEAYNNDKISVITISLSPEWSGGWENSIHICKKICNMFNIDFNLPC